MRIIEKSKNLFIHLKRPRISSEELLKILQSVCREEDAIQLIVESPSSNKKYILEGLDEIKANLPKLVSPLEIRINSVSLDLGEFGSHIRFDEPDRALAENIASHLKPYETPLVLKKISWVGIALIVVTMVAVNYLWELNDLTFWATFLALSLFVSTISIKIEMYIAKHSVYFQARDTFLQRNRDQILLALITAIITAFVTLAFTGNWLSPQRESAPLPLPEQKTDE